MESSQLRRMTIIGMSILCLSPIEFFSNKLFENKENNKNVVMATSIIKLEPNYLSNNYEVFNLNDNTTSENLEKLASENKKKDTSDSENNLESKTTNEEENVENSLEETKEESTNEESVKEESKIEEKEQEVVRKVEQKAPVNDVKKTSTENKATNENTQKTTSNTEKQQVTQEKTTAVKEEVKTTTTAPAEPKQEEQAQQQVVEKPNTDVATSLVNYAKQFVGNPYRYGGSDLYNGTDCSGFTMRIYEHFGYSLPHSSRSQSSYGSYVSTDSLMPGDLIFYGYNGSISHVAIYIGNGQIVHASTSTTGIIISAYNTMPIITARRILK